jgi:DNA polymerase-3 subunit delta'
MSSFEDFRGNGRIIQTLCQALAGGRVPHSLLFAGPEGIGKRTLAFMLAKALNCLSQETGFCDRCASCRKIDAGTHPDVVYVGVLEDKQSLSIDQIRRAKQDVFYQPFEGRFRVFIFDEAEQMKVEAANSILKMLEEPPPSTKLILLTTKFHALLPTVRSRCQVFSFSPLPLSDIRAFLERRTTLSLEDRDLCARLGQGSIGKALSIELDVFRASRDEVFKFIQAATIRPSTLTILELADNLGKEKQSFQSKLDLFYLLLQDLFYLSHHASEDLLTNVDLLPALCTLSDSLPPDWLAEAVGRLDSILFGLRVNINRPIALEDFAFQSESFFSTPSPASHQAGPKPR